MDIAEGSAVDFTDGQRTLTFRKHRAVVSEMESLLGWKAVVLCVEATIPGFTARFFQEAYVGELRAFYNSLVQVARDLKGDASYSDLEGGVTVHVQIDSLGHLEWKVRLSHTLSLESAMLQFTIENDQSYLVATLRQFESFLDACSGT